MVKGVFEKYSSVWGLSLDAIIDTLWEQGCVIDWEDFYIAARNSGMSTKNVRRLVENGFRDSMQCKDGVMHLKQFFEKLNSAGEA